MEEIQINKRIKIMEIHNVSKNVLNGTLVYERDKEKRETIVVFDLRHKEITGCDDGVYINKVEGKQIWGIINQKFREYCKV